MRLLPFRTLATALIAAAVTVPTSLRAQAPAAGVDKGYLDFLGSQSGAPKVSSGNKSVATGPYLAKFGETSALASQATAFDIFCIDWLGTAGDGSVSTRQPWNVRILTFEEAVTAQTPVAISLREKFAAANGGTTGGLTVDKLNKAASIADLMTDATKPQWNEMHVALWNVLWKKGVAGPFGLPGVVNGYANTPWRVDDPGSDPNTAKYYADNASMNFDGSNFRIFVPVKEVKTCVKYRYSQCKEWSYSEAFDWDRQVFMGEVVPTEVPEPGSVALLSVGLVALGGMARRRRRA